ncbi:conserved hypothetical protein [Rhodospirillaceae bacterium LM-1]|nr:conserved hypothetical protein [Rhodospirillaceae bacterium LM-1]
MTRRYWSEHRYWLYFDCLFLEDEIVPERIAIKVLTSSDLTFFDTFYKRSNVGNQKAINLNADVFGKQFYPDYAEQSHGKNVEQAVSVTIYGPRAGKPYHFARSVTKKIKYKNWRLNGAAVPDPEGEEKRFDHLMVGDVAVIEFLGDAVPEAVRIVIVSSLDDSVLHSRLKGETPGGKKSMAAVTRPRLSQLASESGIELNHPIWALLEDSELEELLEQAHMGVEPAMRRLKERAGRRVTKADLKTARDRAERVGDDGEALAHQLLEDMVSEAKISGLTWTAIEDAAASWDFEVASPVPLRFDAKSTTRKFETPFHLSAAETVAASSVDVPYRIIRIYELTEDGASARVSNDINGFAASVLKSMESLPKGVLPEGFTVHPSALTWGEEVKIDRPDEPE